MTTATEGRWPMSTNNDTLTALMELVRSEFMEIPGLSLTRDQIQRLWGLDSAIADLVIAELLHSGFLRLSARGQYVRADLGRP